MDINSIFCNINMFAMSQTIYLPNTEETIQVNLNNLTKTLFGLVDPSKTNKINFYGSNEQFLKPYISALKKLEKEKYNNSIIEIEVLN